MGIAFVACPIAAVAAELCGRPFTTAEALLATTQRDARGRPLAETEEYLAFVEGGLLWIFTKPANAAYPAAICRNWYQEDGAWFAATEIQCGASKTACDQLLAEYERLDEMVRRYVEQHVPPRLPESP